MNRNKEVNYIW